MKTQVENRLAQVRKNRGVQAADLARRVHVSRQTIYAIEAGTYVPNTEVALNLARELEVSVDALFSLGTDNPKSPELLGAEILSAAPPTKGQPVRICQVGSRWIAVPVGAAPYYIPEADGIVERAGKSEARAGLIVFSKDEAAHKRLVMAGCDPAAGILARMVERISGVEIVSAAASSRLALTWLKEGRVHVAGLHMEDPRAGEFNLPFIRRAFPEGDFRVFTFARWEEGLVVAPGNPKGVRKVADLANGNTKLVNREPGSGSRALLDKLLAESGLEPTKLQGYDRVAYGHLAAAYSVLTGDADVCLATRSAAQTFGLHFIPLNSERYDLVMRERSTDLPSVKALLDVLQRATLRRKLEVLAGYDTSETGTRVA